MSRTDPIRTFGFGRVAAFEVHLVIPENQRQSLGPFLFQQGFNGRIFHKGNGCLGQILAFDMTAVPTQLCEHGREADEIEIDTGAADSGRAAHGRVIDLDGFHGLICGC